MAPKIPVTRQWSQSSSEPVWHSDGLAVIETAADAWTITHVPSGFALPVVFGSKALAVVIAKHVATLTDWTQPFEAVCSRDAIHPEVIEILQGLRNMPDHRDYLARSPRGKDAN